jgi:hypothetical protein
VKKLNNIKLRKFIRSMSRTQARTSKCPVQVARNQLVERLRAELEGLEHEQEGGDDS